VFVGDETAVAVTLAMLEGLPLGTTGLAVLGVEGATPPVAPIPDVEVVWTSVDGIVDGLRVLPLPEGTAVYVNGERSLVRQAAAMLEERGVPTDAIATKAYWRRDQPNAAHGEPSKD
jgi:NADPH-dependent ferric siderophore reductase